MSIVLGMDEVGRGSWAGPVFVGAVILAKPIPGLRDSKQLSARTRDMLDAQVREHATAWALGQASNQEIDELGMTSALCLAYGRALAGLDVRHDEIIIDGLVNYIPGNDKVRVLVRADQKVPAVSAASIIAKVARDKLMAALSKTFPGYGFEKHVGYGTATHHAALMSLGPCELHRRSFAPIRALTRAAL